MSTYSGGYTGSARLFWVAAEVCSAAQLWVFILGTRYLSLGVLRQCVGVRHAVSVLVNRERLIHGVGYDAVISHTAHT